MGLCLLSLDAGGTRGVSQLKILAELMHQVNFKVENDQRPCDIFDMIGGSGSGGFIAILLVVFGLSAEEALNEFIELCVNILEKYEMDVPTRTAELSGYIDKLLEKHTIRKEARLLDAKFCSNRSKMVIPISYKQHIGHMCSLRNFGPYQKGRNFTIREAMLATLASPPLFTPTSIVEDVSTSEYISGDLKFGNPTLMIVSEAHKKFGQEARVACLINIGSGHPGFISLPTKSDLESRSQFMEMVVKDSEQKAEEIESLIGTLGLYHRFSVTRGLEESQANRLAVNDVITYTTIYLDGTGVSQKLRICTELLRSRDGVASLGQLKYSGSQEVLPPILPLPTRSFVKRKKPWKFIEDVMLGERGVADVDRRRMLVVTGMGGCGKTQLMLKFIQDHKNKFAATLLIDASSIPRIRGDTIRHVRSLGISHSYKDFKDCLLFLEKPCPGPPRLILYDNADDPDFDLTPLLPSGESCAIVITSRNPSRGQLCPDAHLELDMMSIEEAVDLLLHRPDPSPAVTNEMREAAYQIAQELECLPIALTQARSYIFETQCSGIEYLERLNRQDELMAQPMKNNPDMHYVSTYAAFDASFTHLTLRCQQLLRLLSYFDRRNFPLDLVIVAAKHHFSEYERTYVQHGPEYHAGRGMLEAIFLKEAKWDIMNLDEMIASLRNHSLISILPGIGTRLIQMHHITHVWVKSCLSPQESATYASSAILLLSLGSRREYTHASQYLASHINHMSDVWDELNLNNAEAFGDILDSGGFYEEGLRLRERAVREIRSLVEPGRDAISAALRRLAASFHNLGRLTDAQVLQEEVLQLSRDNLGEMHRDTITASNNLANTLCDLGQLDRAQELQERVLEFNREELGETHPVTIIASNNLANTYRDLGRLMEAEVLQEKVLKLRKEAPWNNHPDTIVASINLANTYSDLGWLQEAQALQEEVLQLSRRVLGQIHPDTIAASSNLGNTYRDLGRLKEAEVLQEEVMKLRKRTLGEMHQDTITASNNLALTYRDLGRLEDAKVLQETMWKLIKEKLGMRHHNTISTSNNLAFIYRDLGQLEDAQTLQKEVLKLRKEVLGDSHPHTIVASNNLAVTYRELGLAEAETTQLNAVSMATYIMGPRHPQTLWTSANLAAVYYARGQLNDAQPLQEDMWRMRKEILGKTHPHTMNAAKNLANTYCGLGRLKEAQTLHTEVLKWREEVLGERHPDTISSRAYLAVTLYHLHELNEAEALQAKVLEMRTDILGERHYKSARIMLDMAETCCALGKKDQALQLAIRANAIISDRLGGSHPMYRRCQEIMSRIQTECNVSVYGLRWSFVSSLPFIVVAFSFFSIFLRLLGVQ